jgi:hypothetical protein
MRVLGIFLAAATLVGVPAAAAKDFGPGDLSVCNAARCVPIVKRSVLPLLGDFYYGGESPPVAARPPLGAPTYELRFRNGYVTGIVATRKLNRFLSYGVHYRYFERGTWYRVPPRLAQELRRLTSPLATLRLTRHALARSR